MCDEYVQSIINFLGENYVDGSINLRPDDNGIIGEFDYLNLPGADFVEYDAIGFWTRCPSPESVDTEVADVGDPAIGDSDPAEAACSLCLQAHQSSHDIVSAIKDCGLDKYVHTKPMDLFLSIYNTHLDPSGDLIFDLEVEDADKEIIDADQCLFSHKSKTDEEIESQYLAAKEVQEIGRCHFIVEKDDHGSKVIRFNFNGQVVTASKAPTSMKEGFYAYN